MAKTDGDQASENGLLISDKAEELFLDYLDRVSRGEPVQFEQFVAENPDQVEDLQRLHAQHQRLNTYFFGQPQKPAPQTFAALAPGQMLGEHRLVGILGQGGMGQVWEAQHRQLGRRVALKVVHPERVSPANLELFAREARAGGRLSHPGIVSVHEVGKSEDLSWISMELVPGARTLRDFLDEQRDVELDEDHYSRVAIFVACLADALESAHAKGVIHRDIKPGNILITASDRPKIADFGLAKIIDEAALTTIGGFAGTYSYMSPEQAVSKSGIVNHLSDVFSLGIVMYEMLAGRRPFDGDSVAQLTNQVLNVDPVELSELRSRVPRDLSVICAKAMEKRPDRRYQSMAELAQDLRRHLSRTPILARPASRFRKVQLWCYRHPTASVSLLLASVALLAISLLLADVTRTGRLLVEKSQEATRSTDEAHRNLSRALVVDDFLKELIAAPSPWHSGYDVTVASLLNDAALALEVDFEGSNTARASLHTVLGQSYGGLGLHEEALEQLERAYTLFEAELGASAPETVKLGGPTASALFALRRVDEAYVLAKDNLVTLTRQRGEQDRLTLQARNMLANICLTRGEFESSKELLMTSLELDYVLPEEVNDALAESHLTLARLYADQAEYDLATEQFEKTIKQFDQRFGRDDPQTIRALGYQASNLIQQGALDAAEPVYEYVYQETLKRFGEAHAITLQAGSHIAYVYVLKGDWAAAEKRYRSILSMQDAQHGPNHLESLGTLSDLAWTLYRQDQLADAEVFFERALVVYRLADPGQGVFRSNLLTNYAQLLLSQGLRARAMPLLREAIEAGTKFQGATHPDVLSSKSGLAQLYEQSDRRAEAEVLRRDLLADYQRVHPGAPHRLVGIAMNNLGYLLGQMGELEEATTLLEEASKILLETYGSDRPEIAGTLVSLAEVYKRSGRYDEAEATYGEGVEVLQKTLGEEHSRSMWHTGEHGRLLTQMQEYDEAEQVLGNLVGIALEHYGPNHTYTARAQHLMGCVLLESGNLEEAEAYLRDAVDARRLALRELGRLTVLDSIGRLGQCLSRLNNFEEAEPLLIEAFEGFDQLGVGAVLLRTQSLEELLSLYERSGSFEKAAEWRSRE